MRPELEAWIVTRIQQDTRLREGLTSVPHVEGNLPYEEQFDEYQVWVSENGTTDMELDAGAGGGSQLGTTEYMITCRVRIVGDVPTLYGRLRQLRNNVYRILRDVPTGPATGVAGARWGTARISRASGIYTRYRQSREAMNLMGLEAHLKFDVEWEDDFSDGD